MERKVTDRSKSSRLKSEAKASIQRPLVPEPTFHLAHLDIPARQSNDYGEAFAECGSGLLPRTLGDRMGPSHTQRNLPTLGDGG
jgi:hypothetical protein